MVGFVPENVGLYTLIDWCTIADTQVIDYMSTWNAVEKKVFILTMESQKVCWMGVARNFSVESRQSIRRKAEELTTFFVKLCKEAVQSTQSRIVEPITESVTN